MNRLIVSIALLVVAVCLQAQQRYRLPSGISRNKIDDQWIIVKLKDPDLPSAMLKSRTTALIPHKSQKNKRSLLDGMCKVKLNRGEDPVEVINQLLKDPNVLYAEPIMDYEPLYSPLDPSNATNQSYLNVINAYNAWDVTRGDDDITIGIIDTGIDLDHEDLQASLWTNIDDPIDGVDNDNNGYVDDYYGYDFADVDNEPESDGSDHGSLVAGIAGATTDNEIGISGVGFNSKIAALKGFRTIGTTSNNLFEAVAYAVDKGIDILNLSWGSLRSPLQSEQELIDYAVLEQNVVVVAAGGNTPVDGKFYPASYEHVLSIGGTELNDNKWSSSTYNYSIDLMAPSTSVYSTAANNGYRSGSGTSFASPMVAGTAALVKAEFPELSALQIMERIRATTDYIYDTGSNSIYLGKLGSGRLNVYRAVSETGVKSIRAIDFQAKTSRSNALFYGDTVMVTAELTNYLDQLNAPQISIFSPETLFESVTAHIFPGTLNTMDSTQIEFEIVLGDNLPPETPIGIMLDLQDESYIDFQFLEVATSPDYFDLGNSLKMTLAGNGNLGYADDAFFDGVGISLGNDQLLTHAGLMIATGTSQVSDNFISNYDTQDREQDFSVSKYFKLDVPHVADQYGYSEFLEPTNNLVVEQSSYSWHDDNIIVLKYRIVNNSPDLITDLKFGFYTDFDLSDPKRNKVFYDATGNYMYTRNSNQDLFVATSVNGAGSPTYSALDLGFENGNLPDVDVVFSDSLKYVFLDSLIAAAGISGSGNDVSMLNGMTINPLAAGGSTYVNVVLAIGTTQTELETNLAKADTYIDEIFNNPPTVESMFSCEGGQVLIDPASGDTFRFYSDPLGVNLLTEATSFMTGSIDKDTAIYVQNLDGAYPSDIFQVSISLLDNVADFSMSTDTLYLDNETNVVDFSDDSFSANAWTWDFGEGTTATIQNPSLAFSQPGQYSISLTVETDIGCSGTKVRQLVVANRPNSPVFDDFTICPADNITLSDPGADKLRVFAQASSEAPFAEGDDLVIGPFSEDTTIYVSGVYGQFESLKAAVTIDVDEVPAGFTIAIDTTSTDHRITATPASNVSGYEWFVNGTSYGNQSSLSIEAAMGTVEIRLEAINGNGCTDSQMQQFAFSSSTLPRQSSVTFCGNDPRVIRPENGEIFGFYLDEALTQLIKKGTQLTITDQSMIYIVGLDDGLPSDPVAVEILEEEVGFTITYESEVVGNTHAVSLSAQSEETLVAHEWYVDGTLVETVPSPVLSFGNNLFEVVLVAFNSNGCQGRDTTYLDFAPLAVAEEERIPIYPNPTFGEIYLGSPLTADLITVWDLSGATLVDEIAIRDEKLDLSGLESGIYLLKVPTASGEVTQKIIKR